MLTASFTDIRERIDRAVPPSSDGAGRDRLVEQLATMQFEIERLKQGHEVLLAALRYRDVLVRTDAVVPMAGETLEISMREALDSAEGLHEMEWDGDTAFRWTGPGHDTMLRLWLNRSAPILFEAAVHDFGDARNRGRVGLFVDGQPIDCSLIDEDRIRSGPLPVTVSSVCTELSLHVPFLSGDGEEAPVRGRRGGRRRPEENGHPRSPRGIAVRSFRVMPADIGA